MVTKDHRLAVAECEKLGRGDMRHGNKDRPACGETQLKSCNRRSAWYALAVPLNCPKIKRLREEMGLSITDAAARAGMKRQQWQRIECGGAANVTINTLDTIASVLGVTAADLLSK